MCVRAHARERWWPRADPDDELEFNSFLSGAFKPHVHVRLLSFSIHSSINRAELKARKGTRDGGERCNSINPVPRLSTIIITRKTRTSPR